ncbi:MAG TPA: MlaD family protein, partial [Solirubrobacteraceae bacterium]
MRRGQASIVANPVLVGAVTILVVVVAVFLAYNANSGLPFVPTRQLNVEMTNGANLVKGNEVRSGGFRIGLVDDMVPARLSENGRVGAKLTLKLDRKIGDIPVDSRVTIRPRSALGLKYVELETGRSRRTLPDGGTLPASRTTVETDLDEVYNIFDKDTRESAQENLQVFGDALIGRGFDLSRTIAVAPSLFGHLGRVMRVLSKPETDLRSFFGELGDTVRVIAPVSATNARLFTTMADTFEAFSRDPQALKDTISKTPSTLDVGTRSLRVQRPFLEHTAALSKDLEAATGELRGALPPLNRALAIGTPVTKRTVPFYERLEDAMGSLRRLAVAPTTTGSLRGLTATVTSLQPQLRFLGPWVTVCNTWNFWWTFLAEHFSSPSATGSEQRALINTAPPSIPGVDGNDNIESDNANEFAHGKVSSEPGAPEVWLHGNFYGSAITPDGKANCEVGQNGYAAAANPYRDRSIKGDPYKNVSVDHPNLYGLRVGSTYKKLDKQGRGIGRGPDQVPAGQTFTWRPG